MASSNKKYYLTAVLTNKCPRCREGNIFASQQAYKFKTNTDMPEQIGRASCRERVSSPV